MNNQRTLEEMKKLMEANHVGEAENANDPYVVQEKLQRQIFRILKAYAYVIIGFTLFLFALGSIALVWEGFSNGNILQILGGFALGIPTAFVLKLFRSKTKSAGEKFNKFIADRFC